MGESAGAASVHMHALTSWGQRNVQRLIMQSGSALSPWAWNKQNGAQAGEKNSSVQLLQGLGVTSVSEMRGLSAETIVKEAVKIGFMAFLPR